MATAVDAAKEFVSGPQVKAAGDKLLASFPLASICEALGHASAEDADPLLRALERLIEFEEIRNAFLQDATLAAFLKQGAEAKDPRVRKMSASLLARLAVDEASVNAILEAGLLASCECLILDEDTGTAEMIAKALAFAARWPRGRDAVCGDSGIARQLHNRLASLPDTERIRVLHLFVELGRQSEESFAVLEKNGAYKDVLGSFLTDDILLKLNAVELMDALGSFKAGQEFLTREGVPGQLASELTDPMNDTSVRVCVVRLLGCILWRAPSNMKTLLPGKDAPFAQVVAEFMDSRDHTEILCALDAWANISMHNEGLVFFLNWSSLLQKIISQLGSTQQEVCKAAMAAWNRVLDCHCPLSGVAMEIDGCGTAQLWELAERQILPVALKNLLAKPFPEVRIHTWQLNATLTQIRSIVQKQVTSEEMRELLFDFSSEENSDARIAKHEFVVAAMKHQGDWLGSFLGEDVEKILTEFARQGPHWAPREAAAIVADESA